MKRITARKAERHAGRRGRSHGNDRPLELERGWHELEAQHESLRSDMMSLAAMLGTSSRPRY